MSFSLLLLLLFARKTVRVNYNSLFIRLHCTLNDLMHNREFSFPIRLRGIFFTVFSTSNGFVYLFTNLLVYQLIFYYLFLFWVVVLSFFP